MTEKLYWADPHRATFETAWKAAATFDGRPSIVLEQSLFYPEGGGQLGDVGTLTIDGRALEILDTQIDDAGAIHHIVAEAFAGRGPAKGAIDMTRRRDHMAQHTAQHALSLLGAPDAGELVVVVQRGASVQFDAGAFIKAQCTARGLRGGGRPERGESRFPNTTLEELTAAVRVALGA